MNRIPLHHIAASLAFCALASVSFGQETRHKEILLQGERELTVTVDVSFGKVFIGKGQSSKIVVADYKSRDNEDKDGFQIQYAVRNNKGELLVKSKEQGRFWGRSHDDDDLDNREWTLKFTDEIPITFRIELGAGKGELDLSGLQIKDMKVSSGASAVEMYCDKPNPIEANSIIIESGVSKFTATNLVNTNFQKLKFSGGVGAYKLDFGGKLRRDADAKIEVGLGAVTINFPRDLPVRLYYDDSWFSSFDLDGDFRHRRSGVYETEGVENKNPMMSIQIESGLGSVKVRRRD